MSTQSNPLISQITEATPVADIAALALQLGELEKVMTSALKYLKQRLRDKSTNIGKNVIEGSNDAGIVTVTKYKPKFKVVKNVDLEKLRTEIGDRFYTYFDYSFRSTLRKDANITKLKTIMGENFDKYFSSEISYALRKDLPLDRFSKRLQEKVEERMTVSVEEMLIPYIEQTDEMTPAVSLKPSPHTKTTSKELISVLCEFHDLILSQ